MKNYAESRKTYSATHRGDEEEAIEFLAALTKQGKALELGIGTGRIAIPLSQRGIQVSGIDISRSTVALLRKRPGGKRIPVTIGNMADVRVGGTYALIYVIWNSFFNLQSQREQITCFKNVSKHLGPGGVFVIEAYVPTFLHKIDDHQYVRAEAIETDVVGLDVLMHDPSSQSIKESHISFSTKGIELCPVVQRYAWPSELDLMAELSGLQLKARWCDWKQGTYDKSSNNHVSVYGAS
jgi:SAM-dependent methyltransferase